MNVEHAGRVRGAAARSWLALAVLAVALAPRPAAATVDVKLWPLFRYASDDTRQEVRWSALGPLLAFTGTRDTRDFRIRPLLWLRQRRGVERDDRTDVLYPLASSRWEAHHLRLRVLLLSYGWTSHSGAPGAEVAETGHFTLFPFIFYRRSPEHGTHLSVLPFYLDQPDFLGYERAQAFLFPAYLRLAEPRVERRFYAFPFVSVLGGADGRGFQVWPFYGDKEIVGREHTRYVLWPFHIRSTTLVPGYGWEERRIDFPVYAAIDGPVRQSRGWGIGAHLHSIDYRRGTESVSTPWPLVVRERLLGDTAWRTWRLAPFYGRTDRDGISSRFYAWPAYRRKTQDVDEFHYQRRDVGLVLWRQVRLTNETSGRAEELLTLFPVLRATRENGRAAGQVPALLDSLLPRNPGVLALWAPLYGLLRWDTRPDGSRDWNLLWGLLAREHGQLIGPWHFARSTTSDGA